VCACVCVCVCHEQGTAYSVTGKIDGCQIVKFNGLSRPAQTSAYPTSYPQSFKVTFVFSCPSSFRDSTPCPVPAPLPRILRLLRRGLGGSSSPSWPGVRA
jgi:hypothetical protein